ncbi:MAG TPA: HD domain-containing protein [Erysipelotrichaceae bacterium]|nr:HD domain-containing protein [Erysipelotrichaceae bacterium]
MINLKCNEQKVMRDPIHEYIHVDYQVIWDVINSKEFQRLRRIHQMGTSYQVYHTAEHSRFSHSLGVYEIIRRMVYEVKGLDTYLDEYEKITIMLAGLCHDLGHGPFSHFFESILTPNHEVMSGRILLEDSDIHSILVKYDEHLPEQIASILNHTHPNKVLIRMISSQLDADRMDYLLRDAYFTGTSYGHFDLERILRTLRVVNNQLVIKESGVHSVEDYIMARYHMYWQVYYHPTSRSIEAILYAFFNRLKDCMKLNSDYITRYPMFSFIATNQPISIKDHYKLDETSCFYGFQCAQDDEDPILSDLAQRIIERKLFDYEDVLTSNDYDIKKQELIDHGYNPEYYLYLDKAEKRPYSPYSEDDSQIMILMPDKTIKELSQVSVIVSAIVFGKQKTENKIFFPRY